MNAVCVSVPGAIPPNIDQSRQRLLVLRLLLGLLTASNVLSDIFLHARCTFLYLLFTILNILKVT